MISASFEATPARAERSVRAGGVSSGALTDGRGSSMGKAAAGHPGDARTRAPVTSTEPLRFSVAPMMDWEFGKLSAQVAGLVQRFDEHPAAMTEHIERIDVLFAEGETKFRVIEVRAVLERERPSIAEKWSNRLLALLWLVAGYLPARRTNGCRSSSGCSTHLRSMGRCIEPTRRIAVYQSRPKNVQILKLRFQAPRRNVKDEFTS